MSSFHTVGKAPSLARTPTNASPGPLLPTLQTRLDRDKHATDTLGSFRVHSLPAIQANLWLATHSVLGSGWVVLGYAGESGYTAIDLASWKIADAAVVRHARDRVRLTDQSLPYGGGEEVPSCVAVRLGSFEFR